MLHKHWHTLLHHICDCGLSAVLVTKRHYRWYRNVECNICVLKWIQDFRNYEEGNKCIFPFKMCWTAPLNFNFTTILTKSSNVQCVNRFYHNFKFFVVIHLIIHKFNVRPDVVQSCGTVTCILLPGFIDHEDGFLKSRNMLLIDM